MYQDSDGFHFMNMESYDQVALPADIIGDQAAYLQPEMEVTISMHEAVPVAIELPPKATLEVVETEPTIKEPDRGLVLQAGNAVERRAHHGAAVRHHRHQDRGDDRRRQLRRAGEGLTHAAGFTGLFLNIYSLPAESSARRSARGTAWQGVR